MSLYKIRIDNMAGTLIKISQAYWKMFVPR